MVKHAEECRDHRHPFGELVRRSPALAVDHHVGVDADRGIVDESLTVDLGYIDVAAVPGSDCRCCLLHLQRDTEILGEMIERAEGEHPKRYACTSEDASHGADAAVAAPHDDCIDLFALGLGKGALGSLTQFFTIDEGDCSQNAMMAEGRLKRVSYILGERVAEGSGARVH